MKLETLYKRAKTGKIQYWQISSSGSRITKESGQLGTTAPITHHEECTGKNIGKSNETSGEEQALSQAQSDWRKKKDEGYKTLKEVHPGHIVGPTPDAGAHAWAVYDKIVAGILEERLPQFNTDANGNVKPMLATDWKKIKKIDYPVLVQPKLDGVRCLMIVGNDDVIFLSRSGKEYTTLDHIRLDITQFLIKYENSTETLQNFILDGEIYSDELTFQEITQAVKKQYPNSLKLHFRAYDVVHEASQEDRVVAHVHQLVNQISSPYVQSVFSLWARDEAEVMELHNEFVKNGYEGAMIRLPEGRYEQGARSRTLLKVKEFNETEYAFLRFEQGQREEDLLAVCGIPTSLATFTEFRAKMEGNRAEKERLKKNESKFKGGSITIKHFGLTTDGIPRFPIGKAFRDYE